jgi:hypothetical protein
VIPKVAVSELPLDHDQRHAFVGHVDGMGVTELVGANRRRTPAACASIQERVKRNERRMDSKMRRSATSSLAVCEANRIM